MNQTLDQDATVLKEQNRETYGAQYLVTASSFEDVNLVKIPNPKLNIRTTFFEDELEGGSDFGLYTRSQIFKVWSCSQ